MSELLLSKLPFLSSAEVLLPEQRFHQHAGSNYKLCTVQSLMKSSLKRACRCVNRFDHHCPAISNCVGQSNQRAYSAWLTVLLLGQLLFLHLAALFCARTAKHHWNSTGQHERGGLMDLLPGVWLLLKLHPGKLLLTAIEVSAMSIL